MLAEISNVVSPILVILTTFVTVSPCLRDAFMNCVSVLNPDVLLMANPPSSSSATLYPVVVSEVGPVGGTVPVYE